ncbi:AraC family transcriptional regulator [Shewanella sp. NIFS-20-20]|uniref:AraC family transcriptional regulator n=1 Tax=Shewanella sp. NIFS-20-20 TaxID=2853806 RepID=UPI001C450EDC|nr:AraC family transcriptional regulator [Shewanella sp. NIFS-20-20]MBV7316567.1 AraC family transcriptional regulator [Shewanella sp. NIFS-20-20]
MIIVAECELDMDRRCHPLQDIYRLVMVLARYEVASAQLLSGSGIQPEDLTDPMARASFNQKLTVFRNILKHSPCADIGLIASHETCFSDFGFMGYALMSAATFEEAVHLGLKYLRLASPVLHKSFDVQGNVARFDGIEVLKLGELLPFYCEYWFGSAHALCCDVLQRPLKNLCLRFPYPPPAYADKYYEAFQCDIEFNSQSIQWEFEASELKEMVPSANSLTVKMCVQSCENMLRTLEQANSLDTQVQAFIIKQPGQFPSAEKVASHFNYSLRTLNRKLSKTGGSYQKILDNTRRELSIKYLAQTNMTIEDISAAVGFTEPPNFYKAFKKWTGKTPLEYRNSPTDNGQ